MIHPVFLKKGLVPKSTTAWVVQVRDERKLSLLLNEQYSSYIYLRKPWPPVVQCVTIFENRTIKKKEKKKRKYDHQKVIKSK